MRNRYDSGNREIVCPVCGQAVEILSPDPGRQCGRYICLECRAQIKEDRCRECYPYSSPQPPIRARPGGQL